MANADKDPIPFPGATAPVEATSEKAPSIQELFDAFTGHLKAAADLVIALLPADDTHPVAGKARYEALTNLELVHMWTGKGVNALITEAQARATKPAPTQEG